MNTLIIVALALVASAAALNNTQIAEVYINLGAGKDPSVVNCTAYADLFTSDGVLHQPGVPDAQGSAQIMKACSIDHGQVNPLVSYQELNIPVTSWNMERRTAFKWTINGVRTSDGKAVSAPAISALLQDKTGKISEGWSFYDTSLISGVGAGVGAPPYDIKKVIQQYMRLGGDDTSPSKVDCSAFTKLFTSDGVSNEPGVPPNQGADKLEAMCEARSQKWKVFAPAVQTQIPILSWDMTGRVAFEWTLAGVSTGGAKSVIPAITVLMLTKAGEITESWDWWNTDLMPHSA